MAIGSAEYQQAERALWDSFGLQPTEKRIHLKRLDVTVRIREVGDGPPVVLVHGASVDGTSWVQLLQGLSGFRCIVLDRPGCGLSDPLPGAAGRGDLDAIKRAADHMIPDVLDALDLDSAHVLATSFGGFFALRAAATSPSRINRIVLYSYSVGVPMDRTPIVMRFANIPRLGEVTARMPMSRMSAKMVLRQVGLKAAIDSGKFTNAMLDWFVALHRGTPTLLNEIRSTPAIIKPIEGLNKDILFPDELLARVVSPVYFFWGEDDPIGGAAAARTFVPRLPDGTLELVPGAGHAPWIDEIDRAIESTCAFLNQTPSQV